MGKRGPVARESSDPATKKKAERNKQRYEGKAADSSNPFPEPTADEKIPAAPIELNARAIEFYKDVWPQLRKERLVTMIHVYQVAIWANAMATAEAAMVKLHEEVARLKAAGRTDENILMITDSKGSSKVNPAIRAISYLMNEATNHGKELGLTSNSFFRMKAAFNTAEELTRRWDDFQNPE